MGKRSSWGLPVLALLITVAAVGCGDQVSSDAAAGDATEGQIAGSESGGLGPSDPTGGPRYEWGLHWPVQEIRRTDSDDTFELVLDDVPVPDGSDLCGAGAVATEFRHGPDRELLVIEVKLDNPSTYPALEEAPCQRRSETITLTVSAPLEAGEPIATHRHGSLDQYFYPEDDGFFECALPACEPATGLPADDPGCETLRRDIRDGTAGLDLPRRASSRTVACDGSWAIVQIDLGPAACPATGDATDTCAGQNLDRAYLHLGDNGFWEVVDWDEEQGCGQVPQTEPSFPVELCQGLPELPRPG